MTDNKGTIETAIGSWLVALAAGTLAGTMLWLLGGWGFMQGAFVGLLVFVVLGALISWIMTRPLPGPGEVKLGASGTAPTAAKSATAAPAQAQAKTATADAPKVQPSKSLPGEAELAARKGTWKYEGDAGSEEQAPASDRPGHLMDKPSGAPDDLKKISGVGPKLEQTLNELGIWHYEQIAKFKKKDIAWVDERLRFKGRIERDDWIGQAKALAKAKG